jgi:twitching motility protein PilT
MASSSVGLFGHLVVELGFVKKEQVDLCLRVQAQLGGKHHLGTLMVHRRFITEEQLQQVLKLQREMQESDPSTLPAPGQAGGRAGEPPGGPSGNQPVAAFPRQPAPGAARPAVFGQPSSQPELQIPRLAGLAKPAPGPQQGGPGASFPSLGALGGPPAAPPVGASAPHPPIQGQPHSKLFSVLEAAERRGASDVHLHPATPIALRQGGRLLVGSTAPVEAREIEGQLYPLLDTAQKAQLAQESSLDLLLTSPGGLRCRASLYRTNTGLNATFRVLRRTPPTFADLGLPTTLASFVNFSQGMVLVTGLAGSGKSSTLAALVNLLAEERADHVLCLEDPVEILHPPKKALVNQRQVGRDSGSFARALRGALREDPDVIVIGELRDPETIQLAVTAAETGHLVLGSMNTASAARAVSRILGAFPPAQQAQVRSMVSESLHGVVNQRLLPAIDGTRALALEILVVTPAISNLIREDKLFQLRGAMQTGKGAGMKVLDDSLRELVASGRVSSEDAKKYADNPSQIPGQAAGGAAADPAPGGPAAGSPAAAPRSNPPPKGR